MWRSNEGGIETLRHLTKRPSKAVPGDLIESIQTAAQVTGFGTTSSATASNGGGGGE